MAARRVADENRKLRSLLAQHGVGDDNVEAFLQSSPTSDTLMSGQFGNASGAVQVLEQLLQTRKSCCADGNTGAPVNGMGGPGSRDSSVASVSTVQSIWDPIHASGANGRRRSSGLQPTGKAASSAHQFMTPSSTGRSTSSLSHNSSHSVPHRQRLAPVALSRNPSPASNANCSQMLDFDSQISFSNPSSYNHQSTAQQHLQPHTAPQRSSVYIPTTTNSNVNSCVFATDMITTMAGVDPSTVRADLGCLPGMDCEVDNHLVFNVMDRYSGTSVGL
jgi:hypothetical protein